MEIDEQRSGGNPAYGSGEPTWRELVLRACREVAVDLNDLNDDTPEATSTDFRAWWDTVEFLLDRLLWDRDFEFARWAPDLDPERRSVLLTLAGIDEDYFLDVAPDPRGRALSIVRAKLRKLMHSGAG